jgi:hypothetical protein
MANISITDLQPAGASLFAGTESFVDSMSDLSENELKMTIGGWGWGWYGSGSGGSGSGGSKSKKSESYSYSCHSHSCGCGYGC